MSFDGSEEVVEVEFSLAMFVVFIAVVFIAVVDVVVDATPTSPPFILNTPLTTSGMFPRNPYT